MMILIISNDTDESTNQIVEWLSYLKKKYIRISPSDKIIVNKIDFTESVPNIYFSINNKATIQTKEVQSYWYRRGNLNVDDLNRLKINLADKNLEILLKDNLWNELHTIKELFLFVLENKNNSLGSYYTRNNNKLIHLSIAKSLGINVPNTIICSSKDQFMRFYFANNYDVITKPIDNSLAYWEKHKVNGKVYAIYTNAIDKKEIKKIPSSFFPTILQQKIQKKIELRIFYLKGKCYSMAIFSQNNKKTRVDFRKYDVNNPNFNVPFKLPVDIKNKINKFMHQVNLDTGSIDMIYTPDRKYYFLEVNPVGQFGVVSYSCNYNLENKIALELSKN